MEKILEKIPEEVRKSVKVQKQPEWIDPMLAKLTHDEFSDKNWIYERKLDGIRCLVFKEGREVRIMSRNGNNLSQTYPEIVEVLRAQPEEKFIIDGEMVAFEGDVTSFAALQKRMHLSDAAEIKGRKVAVFLYVFDLVHIRNLDLSALPVLERKKLLKMNIKFEDPVRYTAHRKEKGLEFFQEACLDNWEGLIAKKAESQYSFGRSSNWLKFKCTNQQELIIGGYTDPSGSRKGFGALLLGYYEDNNLLYAGRVGTGFNDDLLDSLYRKMKKIEIGKPAFSNSQEIKSKNVHWVKPELIAQVSFTEWTSGNKLRHPSFLGLREDKDPGEVVREK